MAKKSAASLSIVAVTPKDSRLPPPASLTARQKAIWRQVVTARPSDWFNLATEAMLAAYVIAISYHEILATQIDSAQANGTAVPEMKKLYEMHGYQAAMVMRLATKMRLTQQSRYSARSAANSDTGKRPWDC